jgi:hypothetical protein
MNRPTRLAPQLLAAVALLAAGLVTLPPARAAAPADAAPWRVTGAERVVAIGDVHGAYEPLVELLRASGLIDEKLAWSGGKAHLVMLGDMVDRGPQEREVLDLIMRLEREAPKAGGQVHVLLGNHEVMSLVGDLRYVSKAGYAGYAEASPPKEREQALARFMRNSGAESGPEGVTLQFDESYPPGYFERRRAFAPDGPYGRWLLSKSFILVIDDVAYVHGGLPSSVASEGAEALNRQLMGEIRAYIDARQVLVDAGLLDPETSFVESFQKVGQKVEQAEAAAKPLPEASAKAAEALLASAGAYAFNNENPFWYRGTSLNPEPQELPTFDAALAKLGAKAAVVGHTTTPGGRVTSRFGGRLLRADTGMLSAVYRGRGAAVIVQGGALKVFYPAEPGDTTAVAETREEIRPVVAQGMPDPALETFLKTAEVTKVEDIGTGITRPKRLTLQKDGLTRRAAFKYVDETFDSTVRVAGKLEMQFNDRYVYDIAAYKLDRLLDMNMVPVAVERTVDGTAGAAQDWIENAIDEGRRVTERLEPYDAESFKRQTQVMRVFDALIYNADRNQGNILYTPGDWKLHLIDHTRAFRLSTGRPPGLVDVPLEIAPGLREKMAALNEAQLKQALGGLLSNAQIGAILKRRDKLLAETGPKPAPGAPAGAAPAAKRTP